MMKTFLATVGGITLLAGAAVSTFAVAAGDRGQRMGIDPDRMVERATKHLDLDESQQAEMQKVLEDLVPVMRAAREERKNSRAALLALDPAAEDYNAQLEVLAKAAGDNARATMAQLGLARQSISAVLNDDQRADFEEWISKSRRWGGKHKHMHKRGRDASS